MFSIFLWSTSNDRFTTRIYKVRLFHQLQDETFEFSNVPAALENIAAFSATNNPFCH